MESETVLKGRNVFVTGGTGLVGSHLVEALVKAGAHVTVLFREANPKSYFFSRELNKKVILANGDLKDFGRIFDIISKREIEYIFHIGAQPIVATAYLNPRETLESNIMGTVNVLESARLYGKVKGIIVASSDKAYGKTSTEYTEESPLKGDHPYDCSKSCTDLITNTYFKTYHLPVVTARFGNIYGPGDLNFNRIIPGIIDTLLQKRSLEIRSDGRMVRDYVYVKDVVNGYLLLANNIETIQGEAFNFSSQDNLSVLDLLAKIETILGQKIDYKVLNIAKNEIPYQKLDYSKVQKMLGWTPNYDLVKAIPETYQWYQRQMQSI